MRKHREKHAHELILRNQRDTYNQKLVNRVPSPIASRREPRTRARANRPHHHHTHAYTHTHTHTLYISNEFCAQSLNAPYPSTNPRGSASASA